MRRSVALIAAALACGPKPAPQHAEPSVESPEPAAEPAAETAEPAAEPAAAPSVAVVPAAGLLGRPWSDVEAALGAAQGAAADGWVRFGDVEARRAGGRCVGLRRQVPEDMDCGTAAESLGFRPAGFPLRRAGGCEWPGISERHRLAPGVAGRYDAASRQIEVWTRR